MRHGPAGTRQLGTHGQSLVRHSWTGTTETSPTTECQALTCLAALDALSGLRCGTEHGDTEVTSRARANLRPANKMADRAGGASALSRSSSTTTSWTSGWRSPPGWLIYALCRGFMETILGSVHHV
jgi:hypothetical protein